MQTQFYRALALSALIGVCPAIAAAQTPSQPAPPPANQGGAQTAPPVAPALPAGVLTTTPCGSQVAAPSATPPANTTFVWTLELCFDKQENTSTIENETYLYYIK